MRYIASLSTVALTLLVASQNNASAVSITGLWNTGLDASGNYLSAGSTDAHYSVTASPSGIFIPVAVSDAGFPFPPWVANNPTASRWIGPATNASGLGGNYIYQTTFNLPVNANLSSVVITGLWSVDDFGTDIQINGNSTGQTKLGFTTLAPFSITSGFVTGLNTIDFYITNAFPGVPNATGLRVDNIAGNYSLVPEPGTCFLGMISLGGLLMSRRA